MMAKPLKRFTARPKASLTLQNSAGTSSRKFVRDFARRSQESITKHHLDSEKPNLHLLSTHKFKYAIYKTGFVQDLVS